MSKQNYLYAIGGVSRTGKSTIARELIKHRKLSAYSTDSVRAGVRMLLLDNHRGKINKTDLSGTIAHHNPYKSDGALQHQFVGNGTEKYLVWKTLKGMIYHHDSNNVPLVVEGDYLSPAKLQALKLENLKLRAVFLGYTDTAHGDTILEQSKKNQHDWVTKWLNHNPDTANTMFQDWLKKHVKISVELRKQTEKAGYLFLDRSRGRSFTEGNQMALDYLRLTGFGK